MLLVPVLQTITAVGVMHALLPLRPTHPIGLRPSHDTNHLIRNRQLRIDSRRKGVNQLRPMMIPEPKHGTAIRAEIPLGRTLLLSRFSLVHDRGVFPALPSASNVPVPIRLPRCVDILNQLPPLNHLQALGYPPQIDAPAVPADFPADAACAQLVGDRGLGVEGKLDFAALAASG